MLPILSNAQKTVEFEISDFQEYTELKGEAVKLEDPLKDPYEIVLIDSLLFLKSPNESPSIDVINLKTGKMVSSFCIRGRGPGELITPFCIQHIRSDNEIMVQDLQGKKLVFFNLDLIIKDKPNKFSRTVTLDSKVLVSKVLRLEGNNYFCNLIGNKDGYMNCLMDEKGNLIRFLEKFPDAGFTYNPLFASNLFPTDIGISDNNKMSVLAYRYSARIDVFNEKGKLVLKLIGPDFKKLDVVPKGSIKALTYKNNRIYNIPCCNNNFFMVPYSGQRIKYSHSPANDILCFDFNGNLLKHFHVSPAVTEIVVDWENRIIYSINKDMEPTLYKYKF